MRNVVRWIQQHQRIVSTVVILLVATCLAAILALNLSPYQKKTEPAFSTDQAQSYYVRATVTDFDGTKATVKFLDGPREGDSTTIENATYLKSSGMSKGTVLLVQQNTSLETGYIDRWRIPMLVVLIFTFLVAIIVIARKKGAMSFVGLLSSIAILFFVVVPGILKGYDTFLVIVCGAFAISIVSIYIAHGVSKRTTLSVISIVVILLGISLVSWLVVNFMGLSGRVDETAVNLGIAHPGISLSGLLAGSIIIATLGILDDVVTTQVASIEHLLSVRPKISFGELTKRGMDIGREHVAALVNTLALAYAGISLPLIIIYVAGGGYTSPLLLVNSEFFAQELTRTIVSSLGLLLAVPLSTYIASAWLLRHRRIAKVAKKSQ